MKKVLAVALFAVTIPLGASAQVAPPIQAGDPTPKMCEKAEQAESRAENAFKKILRKVWKANKRTQDLLTKAKKKYESSVAKIDTRTLELCEIEVKEYSVDALKCLQE